MQISRHALHAMALVMAYPSENDSLLLETKIPNDFIPWIEKNFESLSIDGLNLKIDALIKDFFKVV